MAALPGRSLGKTGLRVTRLGFGSSALRAAASPLRPDLSFDDAGRVLHAVLDAGINYLDTAPVYGVAEELIGRYLSRRRDEFFLAGKVGFSAAALPVLEPRLGDGYEMDWTPSGVRACVEWSLKTMATDHLDVLQVAGEPSVDELETSGVMGELMRLQAEGKFVHLGLTGALGDLDEQVASGAYAMVQFPYSAFRTEFAPAIASVAGAGLGTVVRGGGSARLREAPDGGEWGRFERAELDELCAGESRSAFVLRYTLSNEDVDTTIVGTSDVAHLRDNVAAAARGALSPEVFAEATRRLSPPL